MDNRIYQLGIEAALDNLLGVDRDKSLTAEDLISELAGHGLAIVAVPPGIKYDFVGIPENS